MVTPTRNKEILIALTWVITAGGFLFHPHPRIGNIPLQNYDAIGHIFLFFIGTLAIIRIAGKNQGLLIMCILSLSEEIAQQLFTELRHFSTKDLAMNFVGIGLAVGLCNLKAIWSELKNKNFAFLIKQNNRRIIE